MWSVTSPCTGASTVNTIQTLEQMLHEKSWGKNFTASLCSVLAQWKPLQNSKSTGDIILCEKKITTGFPLINNVSITGCSLCRQRRVLRAVEAVQSVLRPLWVSRNSSYDQTCRSVVINTLADYFFADERCSGTSERHSTSITSKYRAETGRPTRQRIGLCSPA